MHHAALFSLGHHSALIHTRESLSKVHADTFLQARIYHPVVASETFVAFALGRFQSESERLRQVIGIGTGERTGH
jgi:hypothetical protein